MIHMIFHFRTGYIVPSPEVSGRGELVTDGSKIASRYLRSYFLVDILAVLPLPQVVVLAIIPHMRGSRSLNTMKLLKFVVLFQLVPRVLRVHPLHISGMFTANARSGAAFNLLLYMLASHVLGAFWYLFSIERETTCWKKACGYWTLNSSVSCDRSAGFKMFLSESCPIQTPNAARFDFGIFLDALQSGVVGSMYFPEKFFYCFWWGLRNLSSLGQNLNTSTFFWETIFAVSISITGSVSVMLLIGNMQKYLLESTTTRLEEWSIKMQDAKHKKSLLLSTTRRLEEWSLKMQDTEQWMSIRLLPAGLRERIKRYEQYRWQETRGVDEEKLIRNLPKDLRRDIKRHLGSDGLKRVPLFRGMDEQLLDALCGRLEQAFFTEGSFIVREGDTVDEMIFVMDGKLASTTTSGGRIESFNVEYLNCGGFCGEELLTWALAPNSSPNLPISTRTVKALSEVEAFVLKADAMKFVASESRWLHSMEFRYTCRYYSRQWRSWAAFYIQRAWRRYLRKKMEVSLREEANRLQDDLDRGRRRSPSFVPIIYAARFAIKAIRVVRQNGWTLTRRSPERNFPTMLQKPADLDFAAVDEETVAESDSTVSGVTFDEVSKGKYVLASSSEVPAQPRPCRKSSHDEDDRYDKSSTQLEEVALAIRKLTDAQQEVALAIKKLTDDQQEVALAIRKLSEDRLNVNDLNEEVMKTKGFDELELALALDHLVKNEKVAKAFMVKNSRLRKAWLEVFFKKHA